MNNEPLPEVSGIDADVDWRNQLPIELQPVAKEYGRELFATVMNIGRINGSLAIMIRRNRGNNEMMQAIQSLQHGTDQLCQLLMQKTGWTAEQVVKVSYDIEVAASLAHGGKPNVIVLPS